MTYLITFACYGSRVHGEDSGSVDRIHNLPADPKRAATERLQMQTPPFFMNSACRDVVLAAMRERCLLRGWRMVAAHVRTNYAHLVVEAEVRPERIMNDLKSFTSRCLNQAGRDAPNRKRWARHGSTRWLWNPEHVAAAVRYVVHAQGEPMSVYEALE